MNMNCKKYLGLILIITMVLGVTGCKKISGTSKSGNNKVLEEIAKLSKDENTKDTLDQVEKDIEKKREEIEKENKDKGKNLHKDEGVYSDDEVDNDLTKLGANLVYAELYNILAEAESHFGSVMRIKGKFDYYKDEEKNKIFYGVFITDATACCQQGLEFVPKEHYKFPEDYPKRGTWMVVTGEFQAYEEDGLKYCHLINADFKVEKE